MTKSVTRLYQQFQPEHYDLTFMPDRDAMTFSGTVMISGKKIGRPSERLTFHQKELKITAATITKHDKSGDQSFEVARINNQDSLNEVRIHSAELLYPGLYTITMHFEGVITRPMDGIYPCFFKHNGVEKILIATQFESHYARQAFPCIDEPEAKATFNLSLVTPDDETVIANTPIKSQESTDSGQLLTSFETTPRMSTYLLAFAYGELGYTESKTKDGVIVRAYATPDNVKLTEHGLQVAVRALEFFSEYFGVDYPLPKLDMLALPDFSNGAMENWGLVTYRETTMLVDELSSSIESKQLVALVICHELSHQWFGNLVTMKWWDDLWLNESFANMMEYRAVDALYPEWHIWEQFVSTETASAKRRDSLVDVQPIHSDVNHPDEINTLFDPSIVYAKGGSVLYMLMRYIGEDDFRAGLKTYFETHPYKNTEAKDLWVALAASSKHDITAFMADWLNRPGYPLVNIDWEPGGKEIKLQQNRFVTDPTYQASVQLPWQVPLAATYQLSETLLSTHEATVIITEPDSTQPLLFNHDGQSYSLPRYENSNHLKQIVSGIKDGQVDAIDRLLLLDNYTMLQRGGMAATTELLELLPAYEHEDNESVWGNIALAIAETRRLIEGDETSEERLNKLVEKLVTPTQVRLGWEDAPDDSAQTLRLRGLMLSLAIGAKVTSVLDEAKKRFSEFSKPADLAATSRSVVYFAGVRYGSMDDYNKLLTLHNQTTSADERDDIAGALTAAKDNEQYTESLELLTTETIRRQDLMHWFVWLLRNRYSRAAAWEWLTSHWDWIEHEFRSDKSYGFFARYAGAIFSRPTELTQFLDFFGPKRDAIALTRDIALGEQEITSRIAWRQRNEVAVKAWLESQVF